MYQLIALYETPDDPAAFLAHYFDVHMPLVRQIPGLLKAEAYQVKANAMGGDLPYFLIAEMTYPDKATYEAAATSPENRAAGKDLMSFAKGKVTLLVAAEASRS
jgi:uncharacterized protein (TIGR02118 family)